jgi:hypothetical protein
LFAGGRRRAVSDFLSLKADRDRIGAPGPCRSARMATASPVIKRMVPWPMSDHHRRFPSPWTFEDHNNACFIVKDATGFAIAYVYYEDETGRRTASELMTRDEARRIAANIAKIPQYRLGDALS